MNIDAIKARHGSIGPRAIEVLPGGVKRLITEDLPKLLEIAKIADTMAKDPRPIGLGRAAYYIEQFETVLNPKPVEETLQ